MEGGVICILPKYVYHNDVEEKEVIRHGQQLIAVLKTYEHHRLTQIEDVEFFNESTASGTNEIALADFLLDDYLRNGIWIMSSQPINTEAEGQLLWDRTMKQTVPVIV